MKPTTCFTQFRALATAVSAFCPWILLVAQVAPRPAESTAANPARAEEPVQLSVFTVTGETDDGYLSSQTISGSRTVEELRNVPNSISILNRELIEDLAATTVDELLNFAITGETEPSDSVVSGGSSSVFRGIVNPYNLRDGFIWYLPIDTFNVERVELLRGPNAFLYGEAAPGGSRNQLTKRARGRNLSQVRFMGGSFSLIRGELDVNRVLHDKLAIRFNAVAQDAETHVNHGQRTFAGAALAIRLQPLKNTIINVAYERGTEELVRTWLSLQNRFDTTDFNGATAAATMANSGFTYIPALGRTFEMVGTRISTGRNSAVLDTGIWPPEMSFTGPDMEWTHRYEAINLSIEQHIGKNFTMELSANYGNGRRWRDFPGGTRANGIYRDVDATLPGGVPNPYSNQYYTEFYWKQSVSNNIVRDARLAAVYTLELPFTTQRILATGQYHMDSPMRRDYGEFVDPSSSNFKGTLVNANTQAAHNTNSTVLTNNRVYRRFYMIDGDGAALTSHTPVPGTPIMRRLDIASFGGNAGIQVEREFYSPSYGIGSSGSYWNGRIRSTVGWRHDLFHLKGSDGRGLRRSFYNAATDTEYELDTAPRTYVKNDLSAWNVGGVFHATRFLSLSYNWADSYRISQGLGSETYTPGRFQGLATGDGSEIALRWSLFGGKLVSNWVRYETFMRRERGGLPPVTQAVKDELEAIFVDEFNATGSDVQDVKTTGYEFDAIGRITPNWSVSFNFAINRVETSERLLELRTFHAAAKARNAPTPLTDELMTTIVEKAPIEGFNKQRSNLVTKYRFPEGGALKGVSVGANLQYRQKTFLGNFDEASDGVAEEVWAPAYTIFGVMGAYQTRLFKREVGLNLNVNNVFGKKVYRQRARTSALWDLGRTFRLSTNIRL